jgi:phenylpropionate dioxygenase-like ring-hydroxylating dioxygenase large terminal subunit
LLFATFDPEASPLCEYLGEMTWYLDAFFYRREGGIEVISAHKWLVPCNWKFPTENFGGDLYHVQWSHLSAIEPAFSSGVSTKPDTTGRSVVGDQRRRSRRIDLLSVMMVGTAISARIAASSRLDGQ